MEYIHDLLEPRRITNVDGGAMSSRYGVSDVYSNRGVNEMQVPNLQESLLTNTIHQHLDLAGD